MRIKDIPKTCPVVNTKCSTTGVERPREKLIQLNLNYSSDKINVLIPKIENNFMSINKKILTSIKQKPYFSKGDFVLYRSDCLKILEQLPENSADMIFADPPYLLSNGGFTVHAGKRVSVNKGEWDKSNGLKNDFEFHLEWICN